MPISHLVPFNQKIYSNIELPRCAGMIISALDDPAFVGADQADHMRPGDMVIGIVHRGAARAYPFWIADFYHVINDLILDDPVLVGTCERCQSGSAFIARRDDKPRLKFSSLGVYNATLMIGNRARLMGGERSLWIHFEGIAVDGKYQGQRLTQIPAFHQTWGDWLALHPDSQVMAEPDNHHNPDARLGHGREEYFERPGMDPVASQSVNGPLDEQVPENAMVLGVIIDQSVKAYPLRETKLAGGVIHDRLNDQDLVVFSGPRPDQPTMAAYRTQLQGRSLNFSCDGSAFVDAQTLSRWTIEGKAIAGPLQGERLQAVNFYFLRWHTWVYSHTSRQVYQANPAPPRYPDLPLTNWDLGAGHLPLDNLIRAGVTIGVEMPVPLPALPHQANAGIRFFADNEHLNLYEFETPGAAADYAHLEGAWYCMPIGSRVGRKPSRAAGRFVLESDPPGQFEDPIQAVRLPDTEIPWSTLVTDPARQATWCNGLPDSDQEAEGPFTRILRRLRQCMRDIVDVGFLPHGQLYPGTINGISATIDGSRMSVFVCSDEATADQLAGRLPHSLAIGPLLIMSVPEKMHLYPKYEIGMAPEEQIPWSGLLGDSKFHRSIERCLASMDEKA